MTPIQQDSPKGEPFKIGDIVIIKDEWGGDDTPHVIVEWNGDRGFISPQTWEHGMIVPRELVRAEMLMSDFRAKDYASGVVGGTPTQKPERQENAR